jgi:hypothetical protein
MYYRKNLLVRAESNLCCVKINRQSLQDLSLVAVSQDNCPSLYKIDYLAISSIGPGCPTDRNTVHVYGNRGAHCALRNCKCAVRERNRVRSTIDERYEILMRSIRASHHKVHIEWHFMMEKLSQSGGGGGLGVHAHPFTITYKVVVYAPAEKEFYSTPICTVLSAFYCQYQSRNSPGFNPSMESGR